MSHLLFNRCGESIMDNIDIIFDELKRNEIDIDKHTLSFHINTILDRHRDLYRAVNALPCWQRSLFVLGTRRRRDLCLDPTLPQSMIVDESNQFVKQVLKPVLRNK